MRTRTIGMVCAALLAAGCTRPAAEREFTSTLTGYQVPGGGEAAGTGTARLRLNVTGTTLCWRIGVQGIDAPIAAHVHRAAAGTIGPAVVTIDPPPGPDGAAEGCAPVTPELAGQIGAAPHDFYVSIRTAKWPEGAIRGQLRGRGPIRARPGR